VRHKWLALFFLLAVLFYASAIYSAYQPVGSLFPVSNNADYESFVLSWGLIGALLAAGAVTIVLRVLYVSLKRLFA
jgi:hypothetical protein